MLPSVRTFRCFIALYPDAAALDGIAPYVDCLRTRNRLIKWERVPQLHITVKFLGDSTAEQVRSIEALLRTNLAGMKPMEGVLDAPGAFPHFRRPKVVWLGFSKRIAEMDQMHRVVEDACQTIGFPRELKSFTPHFTIGRVKGEARVHDLEKALTACSFQPVPVQFNALRIMESTLSPAGAVHREVYRIEFDRA